MEPASSRHDQPRSRRSRLRVLEAALRLFAERGYEATGIQAIAGEAEVSVGLVCRYFPTKEHFALTLYDRLASALEEWAADMPAGTVSQRFEAAMRRKLELLEPHRAALRALAVRALDPTARAHVLGPTTEVVRSKVAGVFWLAVCGASDAPSPGEGARLARMLYALHLLLVLLFLQDADAGGATTRDAITLLRDAIAARPLLEGLVNGPTGARVDALFGKAFGTSRALAPGETARLVLERIFRRRRSLPGTPSEPSPGAWALHLPRVQGFVDAREPVQLVLPAFPAKSPNRTKVLGKLPDTAEALALESLAALLAEIQEAHAPGAELVLCSDGHVFADAVGVRDADVVAYRRALEEMLADLDSGARIRVFGLEDAFGTMPPEKARLALLEAYGSSVEELHRQAGGSPALRAQIDGIHRFLFEDAMAAAPRASRTQARKATRPLAYEVVRRSDAWSRLVGAAFPRALRLSIHPQPDVSAKIGVAFLPTDDAWLTPWHGVALVGADGARLMRRHEAEALGAEPVEAGGRPMFMQVPS
jgi:pyoverdine/dityrosine biosynthesis protein Dit1/AcrR family transcriptional regulator